MAYALLVEFAGYQILNEEGQLTGEGIGVIVLLAFVIVFCAWGYISNALNKRKGVDSPDMKQIKAIISEVIPEYEKVTIAYANWMTVDNNAKKGKTTYQYWWRAVGFNSERLYVVPLIFSKDGTISYKQHFCIEKSELGMVNAKKDDNWIQLFNKNKEIIMSLRVEKSNVKNLKGCPVNIQQADEEKAWISFVSRWLDEVNRTNGVTASGHHSWSER